MYSPHKQTEKKNFLYQLPFAIIHEVPCFPQLKVASSNLPIERCVDHNKSDQVLAIYLPKVYHQHLYSYCLGQPKQKQKFQHLFYCQFIESHISHTISFVVV